MPLKIITEEYNTLNSLYANAGDWVEAESKFNTRFYTGSGASSKFHYFSQGGVYWIENVSGNLWADDGFLEGDSITMTTTYLPNGIAQSWTRTITYISGNKLYFDSELLYFGTSNPISTSVLFPTDAVWSGLGVLSNKLPNSLEFYFNLTPDGTTTLNSLIDGELNRFELQDVDTMTPADALPMVQLVINRGV